METNTIYNENCLETMKRMPGNFIDCVVTSPPYWGLRDYGHKDQIGLEATPEEYVSKMVEVFQEVRRVLKPEGTVWLNLGDSYAGSGKAQGGGGLGEKSKKQLTNKGSYFDVSKSKRIPRGSGRWGGGNNSVTDLKPKDLIGIPWRVAFALQSDGWWLRQDIIWAKPNPMPESVKDRCTKSHEYIFLLTKSKKYYYDWKAVSEVAETYKTDKRPPGVLRQRLYKNSKYLSNDYGNNQFKNLQNNGQKNHSMHERRANGFSDKQEIKRNRRSVWSITTESFPDAHFATFPTQLPSLCILAGCPKDGIVYDPFIGAATTALAALKYGRQFIGSEINPEYCEIGNKRIAPYLQQMTLAI